MAVNYICPECGSDDLCFDSTARWDFERQEFLMSDVQEGVDCGDCFNTIEPKMVTS